MHPDLFEQNRSDLGKRENAEGGPEVVSEQTLPPLPVLSWWLQSWRDLFLLEKRQMLKVQSELSLLNLHLGYLLPFVKILILSPAL